MSNTNKPVRIQKAIVDDAIARIEEIRGLGALDLPKDYSVANAIQAAGIILATVVDKNKKPALEVCTRESIANSLFYMATQGLNPLKGQCYFIVYGKELNCKRSYEGAKLLAKRFSKVKDVHAHTIYKGDDFKFQLDLDSGMKKIISHEFKLENIKQDAILGAYAIVVREDGSHDLEVMTIDEIKEAWMMRQGTGLTDAHKKFTNKMCEKTVINRACKKYIDSTNDEVLINESSANIITTDGVSVIGPGNMLENAELTAELHEANSKKLEEKGNKKDEPKTPEQPKAVPVEEIKQEEAPKPDFAD